MTTIHSSSSLLFFLLSSFFSLSLLILQTKWSIKLDHKAVIFQNLQGAVGDVQLRFDNDGNAEITNAAFQTEPVVIHGNGHSKVYRLMKIPTSIYHLAYSFVTKIVNHHYHLLMVKVVLNSLGNYLAKAWSPKHGCLSCQENRKSLAGLKVNLLSRHFLLQTNQFTLFFLFFQPDDAPSVLIGIFIVHPTPFIDSFFAKILQLRYPKEKISLIIYNKSAYHDKHVENFVKYNTSVYNSVNVLPDSVDKEWQARNMAM